MTVLCSSGTTPAGSLKSQASCAKTRVNKKLMGLLEQEDQMGTGDEDSDSREDSLRLFSDSSSAEAQLDQKNEQGPSVPICPELCFRNTRIVAVHNLVNGHASHMTGSRVTHSGDNKKRDNDFDAENSTKHEIISYSDNVRDERDIGGRYYGGVGADNNDDNDRGNVGVDGRGGVECDDDVNIDGDNDGRGNDGHRGNGDRGDDDEDGIEDDDDDKDDEDDDDEDDEDEDDGGPDKANKTSDSYLSITNEDVSNEAKNYAKPESGKTSVGLRAINSRDEVIGSTENVLSRSKSETHDVNVTPVGLSPLQTNNLNSRDTASGNNEASLTQGARPKTSSNSRNEVIGSTENGLSRLKSRMHEVNITPVGFSPLPANRLNSRATAPGNNAASLTQGARPKTSTQRSPLAGRGYFYKSRVSYLEDTGIHQDFLARHTTDASLPYASQPSDWNLSGESTLGTNRRMHAASRSNDNAVSLWSLSPQPGIMEQRSPHSSGLLEPDIRYQATSQGLALGTDWQLLYQSQSERNVSHISTDHWTANQQSLSHISNSENAACATGHQVGNSSNGHSQAWMPNYHVSSSHPPNYDVDSSQANSSSIAPLNSRLPAVIRPSVTMPGGQPHLISSMISQSVPPNGFTSSALRGFNGNEKLRWDKSTRPGQSVTVNQGSDHLSSSEIASSGRKELISSNGGSHEALPPSGNSLQVSSAQGSSGDYTLVALGRKMAEACAVVERVKKEREERIKAQREAALKERERRERIEREERERKEKEQREREEREMREREREASEREAREREAREMREMEATELREREGREQSSEERGGTWTPEERLPIQESSHWQCEHYQRRCSVSFPCCGVFYPCHRCHNGSEACDVDDMKAYHATHVKCGNCGHEEEINETSQHCSSCGERFSEYFCYKCKHFTGVQKNPFHCEKCKICRIHRNKSFHCDVCNVCLDKRLEGKHKCRPNSGHDECCICLEDAFSGCQILPCSHKVHKECAIAMIQNGVRNCPICRHPLFDQGS